MTTTVDPACDQATVIDWWRQQCERSHSHTAVISEDRSWTYQELNQLVNQFSRQLMRAGCGKGSHIGLCVDRSAEAIAAMLGVMQIGAAFVPLDPEYPVERLASMVDDAEIDVIIGHACYQRGLGASLWQSRADHGHWIDCESVDRDSTVPSMDHEFHQWFPQPSDLAYLMYTSGSTGTPKGVEISQQALVTYCAADIQCYRLTPDDRTLQFSTLCFDIAIEEIFPPLLSGGAVVIRPRGRANDRNELSSLVDRFQISAVHLATAYWHNWVDLMVATGDRVPRSLRLVIATGEKVSTEHYHRWQSMCDHRILWCNAYGPTEATVTATVYVPDESFDQDNEAGNMPIGKPLPGYTAHILDKDLQVLGVGETGELCIGGPALACGYHKRPELTRHAFISVDINGTTERLYRTGDVARWLPDGNIEFGGRFDHQIKLGSYRIEPGEIEVVLDRFDGVLESLVSYDEVDGKKYLVAYIAVGSTRVSASEIAEHLRQSLPPYMIPARFVMLETFPKTINGKIDRTALPSAASGEVPHAAEHVPPRDELEQRLADLWKEVLHLPEIGIHDDFFLLGGSSLLVTQVITSLTTDLEVDLPVRDFFANPTIATSARQIRKLLCETDDAVVDEHEDATRIRARLPQVNPAFFDSAGYRLFSVRYRPATEQPIGAVVLAHSIGHEYARGYRNMQQLAVQLCRVGLEVLRFDYAGTGNSQGDCSETNADLMQQNLIDARNFLVAQSGIDRVAVVGLRLGAMIAASLPSQTFSQVLLWDPVESGESFLRLIDRFHERELQGLTRYNAVRIGDQRIDQAYGHRMSPAKRSSIAALSLNLRPDHQVISTDDEILWEDARFTEAAFSSPESFAAIQQALLDGLNRIDQRRLR